MKPLQHRQIRFTVVLICFILGRGDQHVAVSQDPDKSSNSEATEPTFTTPPAPALRPGEAMETFQLVPGYHLELVASDPLIQDPVVITFDPCGRLWVCEMRGFMPDIDGTDEEAPVGVISVLDDTDGDGVMDKSTIFLDSLVLPRGLCWTIDGILVCENGTIWLCRDKDGDDRCDEKQQVCTYNPGNLEHSLNGLMPALDNWIYNAKEGIRLRRIHEKWVADPFAARGQWGITQDNNGYLYYNVNASLLRGDLVPCYSSIAQNHNPLIDAQLYDQQVMFPIRPTPGINRGYIPGFLRADGSLIEANSNCGPVVYRGDNLPSELLGNVFIPEPAGNLVRRQVLFTVDGRKTSRNAYRQREFLASTDERFRPVNMFNAPDGTLYIVDMYRGIIQHGDFITPYLRQQILDRQLDKEFNLGRIYRVAHESTQPRRPVAMSKLSSSDLVAYLSNTNGWHRDMAQQLIVQRGDLSVVAGLEQVATDGKNPLGRLHALWTLEGLDRIDPEFLYEMLSDEDANVRASAVTLYRRFLTLETMLNTIVDDVAEMADDENAIVRMQVVQTLGLIHSLNADRALEPIFKAAVDDQTRLVAVLSGFAGQESEFLSARLSQERWKRQEPWREQVLSATAGVMWGQRDSIAVLRFCHLLDSLPSEQSWQRISLLEGVKDPPRQQARRRFALAGAEAVQAAEDRHFSRTRATTMRLESAPEGLARLRQSPDARLAEAANAFAEKLIWPGKDGLPMPKKPALTDAQQRLYDLGKREYSTLCASCHHALGYGLAAKGPQLLGSQWLQDEQRLIRLVLDGIQGPIAINEQLYNYDNRLSMPGMSKTLDDEKLAGVLTYVRREFIDHAPPVDTSTVEAIRNSSSRTEPWTELELLHAEP